MYLRALRPVWRDGRGSGRRNSAENTAAIRGNGYLDLQRLAGLQLAYEHTMIQLHPSPFMTCDFMARFPDWLPLGKWLPQVFVASGDCAERQWSFLTLEMPQWLLGIFAAYLVVAIAVVIAQAFKPKKRDLFGR